MSEETNEKEMSDAVKQYELSETPLGGYRQEEPPAPTENQEEKTPVEQEPVEQSQPETPEAPAPVDYSRTFKSLSEGEVVGGIVVQVDREGVLVDVGSKSEGLIPPHELSRDGGANPEDIVSVGEKIDVYVMQVEGDEGNILLSKKRADFERAWEKVEQAHRDRKTINAMVTDRVKGGLVVDLGIRGFVPASQIGSGNVKNVDKYIGQSIPLKVIEVDKERRKVVLSHKMASEEERGKRKAEIAAELAEGQIRQGIVRRLTDYGAFVDLGGMDGLLHISEMSWTRIKHPSEILKVGQKIQVVILKLNIDQERISLGLRQILPDPWSEIPRKYKVGDVIQGKVTRLVPFGAFIQVEGGIEGIIPNSELARRRVSKPEDVVSVGQEVEVSIIDLRPDERRMTLSLRALEVVQERVRDQKEMNEHSARPESRTTIGDLVGAAFLRQQEEIAQEEAPAATEEAPVEAKAVKKVVHKPQKKTPAAEAQPEASAEAAPKKTRTRKTKATEE